MIMKRSRVRAGAESWMSRLRKRRRWRRPRPKRTGSCSICGPWARIPTGEVMFPTAVSHQPVQQLEILSKVACRCSTPQRRRTEYETPWFFLRCPVLGTPGDSARGRYGLGPPTATRAPMSLGGGPGPEKPSTGHPEVVEQGAGAVLWQGILCGLPWTGRPWDHRCQSHHAQRRAAHRFHQGEVASRAY